MTTFGDGLAKISRERKAGVTSVTPRTEPSPREPGSPDMRSSIASLLRGERKVEPAAPVVEQWFEFPGAAEEEIAGSRVLTIRRWVDEFVPELAGEREVSEGLAALRAHEGKLDHGLAPAQGFALEDVAVVDLETTGFWGCPLFLVGILVAEEGRFQTIQFLARNYAEEAAVVRAAVATIQERKLLVTFNGKSYDVPCLSERAVVHRIPAKLRELSHVDVLHPSRRLYRDELPDCRLQTLERHVVGIHRTGDVASADIPAVYHNFTATGFVEPMLPVLHHSRIDVVTTVSLLGILLKAHAQGELARLKLVRS